MHKSVAVFLLLGLGVALGVALALIAPEPDERQAIEWLDTPRGVGRFSLATEAGHFDNQSLTGQWTIVWFGFLHCPDICPTSLSQMANLADRLAAESIEQDIALVFVSVDPQRDSAAEISQYVRHFDPSIRGATGTAEQLTQFASDLGIQFKVSADDDDYTVAHSITFSIIGPEGLLRGRFRPGFDALGLLSSLQAKTRETG